MPITQRNKIGMLEAMLFANAEPVETDRLAEAMRADPAEVLTLLEKLQKRYDETESGLMLLHFDGDRWQMATRPYYGEVVKRILDTRRNAPLSPAALEVLAIIAYNQPVSRSFIEQVRGVDSSSTGSSSANSKSKSSASKIMPIIFSTISTTANTALIAVPPGFAAPAVLLLSGGRHAAGAGRPDCQGRTPAKRYPSPGTPPACRADPGCKSAMMKPKAA